MQTIQQFRSVASGVAGRVDKETGIIHGVSVISEGPAIGHQKHVDHKTLESVLACTAQYKSGLKVKLDHGSKVGAIVGTLRDFRIDGTSLRADLKLLKASPHFEYVAELATEAPESFGLSIVFSGDAEKLNGLDYVRCAEVYSCDLVDAPAANPSGLFSEPQAIQNFEARLEALSTDFERRLQEVITQLRSEMASADILASRKVASFGMPAGSVSMSGGPALRKQDGILEQLAELKDPLEINRFTKEHRDEIFKAHRKLTLEK
jgi:hypothetical protein